MAYEPPKYPGQIPTAEDLPDRTDDIDWLYAARYNELKKELRAALIELGVLPKGSHADVKTRLDVQQHKIIDVDGDSYEDVEKTADVDEAVTYLKDILVRKFHDDGTLDLPKQSGCRVYKSAAIQSIPTNTFTKVVLDGEDYDIQNEFDPTTHYRFTAKKAGRYLVIGSCWYNDPVADKIIIALIYKNGANINWVANHTSHIAACCVVVSEIAELAANDYLEFYTYHECGIGEALYNGPAITYFAIHKLS